eukprot:23207-Eustigmatos_ZCMA.PRE.1
MPLRASLTDSLSHPQELWPVMESFSGSGPGPCGGESGAVLRSQNTSLPRHGPLNATLPLLHHSCRATACGKLLCERHRDFSGAA